MKRTDLSRRSQGQPKSDGFWFVGVLAIGMAVRYAIAPFASGFGYDIQSFVDWARILVNEPFKRFYAEAQSPDHLPGDLWFLWAATHLFQFFGGSNLEGTTFVVVIKSISILGDACIGILIYATVRQLRSERAALVAAALYLLNPASIFMSAVWGQWDSVSVAMVLFALWWFLKADDRWLIGVPFLAWALMIKPQLALLAPFLLAIP
ncbi:MAG TPA: glycosyltransferase family 39 protein, partial [Thermomicrobiales bacterium]|nr:glycosyltransferase family 39 protein [Thermomicrobiales bacterium]